MNKQNPGQWQPQAQPSYNQQQQQQGYPPQRPLHPSVASSPSSLVNGNRSNSPQPSSPISPSMHINTKTGGSTASQQQQQRSNPSSPAVGSAGNVMEIAARHYEALQQYLLAHILKEKHGVSEQRIAAREKLSRLLQNQLQDLSTDVYDELKRRTDGAQVPFLAVRDDYHPKRNQARQKLATLPQNRFKDLASDVYVQLERQFPTLLEMFPLKALEEKEFLSQPPASIPQAAQQDRQEREAATPVVQQSSVVPNVATFTIQDSSNVEDEAYYRSPGQQSPTTPTALEGNVNFASLDSLMTDIGQIVSKDSQDASKSASTGGTKSLDKKMESSELMKFPKDQEPRSPLNGLGIDSGSPLTDQMKQEYEIRISALCKRLQHLESEMGENANRPEGSRLSQVERQLAKQIELYNEQSTRVTKLQLDYNKVLNDYHAQLETVDMVNQEVKSLVMDNKNLKQRHLDAEEELQLAYNRIKQLEDENSDLKADLEDALHREKVAQDEAGARSVIRENNTTATTPAASISTINVNTKDLTSSHHDAPHSDDDGKVDLKSRDDNDDDWNQERQQIRASLLVNPNSVIHQDSLNNFRNAIDDLLTAGRSDSSSSVLLGMKSVVIACKAVTEDVEDYEHDANDNDSFAELKQELSSGLTQLMNSAKAHSNAFNEDEDEFERSLNDLEAAADQLEAIVMDIVNVPKHSIGAIKENGHHARDHHDDDLQGGINNHDGHHEGPNGNGSNNINNNDGPMDSQELKIYLETQTGLIVSSIQTLMRSLRSGSDSEGIIDSADDITKVVDQVTRQTRITLETPDLVSAPQASELRAQGEMVLEDLENSVDLLSEIKEQLEADPELVQSTSAEAKALKQKMASAGFDIAKYAKELAGLIED
ncbi:component of the polarisome [Linnemannia zychae]|nr:component of the polarisome [Linnemannia zychae]